MISKPSALSINFPKVVNACILSLALLVCAKIYVQSLSVGWFFDDWHNLRGLAKVEDVKSLWQFISTGLSSPHGRPVSLLSFSLNSADWVANNPAGFRWVSLNIHLINILLVYLLVFRLSGRIRVLNGSREWVALAVALFWGFQPLHFTAYLMVVQRMTLLSGLFTLLGLVCWSVIRENIETSNAFALKLSLVLVLGVTTILSFLSKETGSLLPLYCFCLEITFFRNSQLHGKSWCITKFLAYYLPLILLVSYFAFTAESILNGYYSRPFKIEERLATEVIILWEYLRQCFIPYVQLLGPFQDDHTIYSWRSGLVWLAFFGWVGALTVSIKATKKYPWFTLMVWWFLVGHILESSVISLELYFEHRNYLPLLGVCFGCVWALFSYDTKFRWVALMMPLISGIALWSVSSLWSKPLLASEMMVRYHPYSERAAGHLAVMYEPSDVGFSYAISTKAKERMPQSASLYFDSLQYACFLGGERVDREMLSLKNSPQDIRVDYLEAITSSLESIYQNIEQDGCSGVDIGMLISVLKDFRNKPLILNNKELNYRFSIVMAGLSMKLSNTLDVIGYYQEAFEVKKYPALAIKVAYLYLHEKEVLKAENALMEMNDQIEWGLVNNEFYWKNEMLEMWTKICADPLSECKRVNAKGLQ